MKFLIFLAAVSGGFATVKYSKWIVDNTMHFPSVENFLGPGGTYTFWKLAGIAVIGFGFYYLVNG